MEQGSKLSEQATAKADLSYSYWAASSVRAGAPTVDPANAPKKLTPEEAAALRAQTQQQQGGGNGGAGGGGTAASAWNAAGTYEERDVTAWAKPSLSKALAAVRAGQARVAAVDRVIGHASVFFIRGSKRAGFEFSIDLTWAVGSGEDGGASGSGDNKDGSSSGGGKEGDEVRGTLKLHEAGPDDLDDLEPTAVAVTSGGGDGSGAAAAAIAAARGLAGPLRAALRDWYENELKQQ